MKTIRIEFLASPEFKASLQAQAAATGTRVAELIRRKFTPAGREEAELHALIDELKQVSAEARAALTQANLQMEAVLTDLRARRRDQDMLAA